MEGWRRKRRPTGLIDSVFNSSVYGWGAAGEGRVLVYKLAKGEWCLGIFFWWWEVIFVNLWFV